MAVDDRGPGAGVRYYRRDGSAFESDDPIAWATEYESVDRHVADDRVGEVRVSTVWLGLDHSFGFGGPPLIFETMILRWPVRPAAGPLLDRGAGEARSHPRARRDPGRAGAGVRQDHPLARQRALSRLVARYPNLYASRTRRRRRGSGSSRRRGRRPSAGPTPARSGTTGGGSRSTRPAARRRTSISGTGGGGRRDRDPRPLDRPANGKLLDAADAIGAALREVREANAAWVELERDYLHAKAIARAHAKAKLVADREDEVYLTVEREWVAAKGAGVRRETAKEALRACMAVLSGLQSVASAHREEAKLATWSEGRSA